MNTEWLKSLTHFLGHLFRFSRKRVITVIVLTIAGTFTSGIGILGIIPFLEVLGASDATKQSVSPPPLLKPFLESLDQTEMILVGVAIYAVLSIVCLALMVVSQKTSARFRLDVSHDLNQSLFTLIAGAKWSYLTMMSKTDIEHMLTVGLRQLSQLGLLASRFVSQFILVVIYSSISCVVSIPMTVLAFSIGGLGLWVSKRSGIYGLGRETYGFSKLFHLEITRFFEGIKPAKANNATGNYLSVFNRYNNGLRDGQYKFIEKQQSGRFIFQFISILILSTLLVISLVVLKLSLPKVVVLFALYGRLMPKLMSMQQDFYQMISISTIYEQYLMLCDKLQNNLEISDNHPSKKSTLPRFESLTFNEVEFSYPQGNFKLGPISSTLSAGDTVAILGASGSGKSTFADLFLGLNTPTKGSISLNGELLTDPQLYNWREQVAYVPQEGFLINATIRENIEWPSSGFSDKDIWAALDIADSTAWVSELPDQLDTVLGERGVRLSGGQRQRIVLARALLKKPAILLLDEATNALDIPCEERILTAVRSSNKGLTLVHITHRQDHLSGVDQKIVFGDGKLVYTES